MAAYFERDDVALHNVAKFMRASSDEEREHAVGLMKFVLLPVFTLWFFAIIEK